MKSETTQARVSGALDPFVRNCGRCHECGGPLRTVLDGEEWCGNCQSYRRYRTHGWGSSGDAGHCLANAGLHRTSEAQHNERG